MGRKSNLKKRRKAGIPREGDLVYLSKRIGFTPPGIYLYEGIYGGLVTLSLGTYYMAMPREALSQLRVAKAPDFEATIQKRMAEFASLVASFEREFKEAVQDFGDDFFEINNLNDDLRQAFSFGLAN